MEPSRVMCRNCNTVNVLADIELGCRKCAAKLEPPAPPFDADAAATFGLSGELEPDLPAPRSVLAVVSVVMGVGSLLFLPLAIPAIITGIMGLKETRGPDGPRGRNLAMAGMSLGIAVLVLVVLLFLLLMLALAVVSV